MLRGQRFGELDIFSTSSEDEPEVDGANQRDDLRVARHNQDAEMHVEEQPWSDNQQTDHMIVDCSHYDFVKEIFGMIT